MRISETSSTRLSRTCAAHHLELRQLGGRVGSGANSRYTMSYGSSSSGYDNSVKETGREALLRLAKADPSSSPESSSSSSPASKGRADATDGSEGESEPTKIAVLSAVAYFDPRPW